MLMLRPLQMIPPLLLVSAALLTWLCANEVQGFGVPNPRARRPMRLQSSASATLPEGIVKTMITSSGSSQPVRLGDIVTVEYSCYVVPDATESATSESSPHSSGWPFCRSARQKMVVGDGTMIAGWDIVLRTLCVGDTCRARVAPPFAYGAAGWAPLVPPHASIDVHITVLDTQAPTVNIDFDALADTADPTPRTASDIAAAYATRQALQANEPELEGWDWAVAKLQSFYFFGLFEGETGQQAPWFLRPSITFPLAFLIVGATFYVSFVSGAITERGAQTTDELDEVILVTSLVQSSLLNLILLYT